MKGTDIFGLTGKRALITGSSGGLGFVIAQGLGEAGASIVLNGRNEAKLTSAVSDLQGGGLTACGRAFDVTDSKQVAVGIAAIEKDAGAIDILVNNAGIQRREPLETMSEEAWRAVIDTNLTAAFLVTRCVVTGMISRGAGKIINVCSLMSEVHRSTLANYSAAKGGLKMLTRAMAVEWGKHNIQANGIGPGYVETEMTRPLVEDEPFNKWLCERTPAGRWGKPEELVGAAVFLASEASSYVNGQILYVDGGLLAGL